MVGRGLVILAVSLLVASSVDARKKRLNDLESRLDNLEQRLDSFQFTLNMLVELSLNGSSSGEQPMPALGSDAASFTGADSLNDLLVSEVTQIGVDNVVDAIINSLTVGQGSAISTNILTVEDVFQQGNSNTITATINSNTQAERVNTSPSGFSQAVGFCVRYKAFKVLLRSGSVLKPNHIMTNYGNDYSTNTGHFIAPREGMYSFHLHLVGYTVNRFLAVDIYVEDGFINRCLSRGLFHYGSTSFVIYLKKGMRVYLKQRYGFALAGSVYTTWCGYYLGN